MKKITSIIICLLLVFTALCFTGCGTQSAQVISELKIEKDFTGFRTVTVKYPHSCDIDSIKDEIIGNNPIVDIPDCSFDYLGVEKDGYVFELSVKFSSKEDYEEKVSKIIGREASLYLMQKDTALLHGIRVKEDFDTSELISFMRVISNSNNDTKDISYVYGKNTVSANGKTFDTSSTVDISSREGESINFIKIQTVNSKKDLFDRTFVISISNETYEKLKDSLNSYFETNTSPRAVYYGFTNQGETWEYQVIYKDITLDEMKEYTAMMLDTNSTKLFYGDRDNASTPLSEGLTFEENFDTFSFLGKDNTPVELYYDYALPTLTTHGDGSIMQNGEWCNKGEWIDGVYTLEFNDDVFKARIPDGIEYNIKGINFDLEVEDENSFVRRTEFLYSKQDGINGRDYAYNYFLNKNADVESYENDDSLVCCVTLKGTSAEITEKLVKFFGSGNFLNYEVKENALSLSKKTTMTDYISLGHMLNSNNALQPMRYTVTSKSNENISSLNDDLGDTSYNNGEKSLSVNFSGGKTTAVYHGNIPIYTNIIVYIVICSVLLSVAIFFIVFVLRKNSKKIDK